MSIKIKFNGSTYTLGTKEFVQSGGEGSVYTKNGNAIKIYNDPKKLIPLGKIHELSVLEHDRIIRPLDMVFGNTGNIPVGYVMKFVHGLPLCQLFTRAFRERNNIKPDMVLNLAKDLRDLVQYAHEHNILIVDLNEMNFLSSKQFNELYAIDVDSWQTKNYPATAIMESVRDWHSGKFNEGSDWFSYAIVSFQLLIGIHPYRGRHTSVKNLTERMIANLSVFNRGVSVPSSCYSVDSIPPRQRAWYIEVFEHTLREPPPFEVSGMLLVPAMPKRRDSVSIKITQYFEVGFDIVGYEVLNNAEFIVGKDAMVKVEHDITTLSIKDIVGILLWNGVYFGVQRNPDQLTIYDLSHKVPTVLSTLSNVKNCMIVNGTLYYSSNSCLFKLRISGVLHKLLLLPEFICELLDNTVFYSGVIVQNMLGTYYATIFSDSGGMWQIKLPVDPGHRIVDVGYSKNIIMIISEHKSVYCRHVCMVSNDGNITATRSTKDIALTGLNFIVLDNGIVAQITDTDEMELFRKDDVYKTRNISDASINSSMRLFTDGGSCYFIEDNSLMKLELLN